MRVGFTIDAAKITFLALLLLPALLPARVDARNEELLSDWNAMRASAPYREDVADAPFFGAHRVGRPRTRPAAVPDIIGPGAVLNVGNVFMKVTNLGLIGNPFLNLSNDPSAQYPGASGVEYLNFLLLAVGGVNPTATDPLAIRRVSFSNEWRPATLDPEDRMYRAYDGIVNGQRLVDDDQDDTLPEDGRDRVDEDFLDGRDNDADGRIDEDYAAYGQQMWSCVIRDDTPAAINTVFNEKHVPIGLECRQVAWAYSVTGLTNFNPIEFTIINRSGHTIDSMYFGIRIDLDAGPLINANYFVDDFDVSYFPQGDFTRVLDPTERQRQVVADAETGQVTVLCPEVPVRIRGFSVADNENDEGRTTGVPSMLLLGHTTDPLGVRAPARVGWRAFRSFVGGTPYTSNGNPAFDQERYELMSGGPSFASTGVGENLDPETGFITQPTGDQEGDYGAWASVGPFFSVPNGGSIQLTIAVAIADGNLRDLTEYPADYESFRMGRITLDDLFDKYPGLENAYTAQVAYDGKYESPPENFLDQAPDCHGCETALRLPAGSPPTPVLDQPPGGCGEGFPDPGFKMVTADRYTWFNYDCDWCTGVYDAENGVGLYLRRWVAESPPPNPNLNVAATHNYTDNPDRVTAAGDRRITLAWDNLSETSPDPKTTLFDFRHYRIWKVAGWTRPVGSAGPSDDDWQLLAEFEKFDTTRCETIFLPAIRRDTTICVDAGEFLDRQSGQILRPDLTLDCVREDGECATGETGCVFDGFGRRQCGERIIYPVGRYQFVDREVRNGFVYFYSVTAGDVDGQNGRRSAVEAEGVTPQASAGASVWVVPNPYRGFSNLSRRSSAWDLTPNAADPTGTHVDFMGLPASRWKIRIFTVSGDLVAELNSTDPVNESLRAPVTGSDGVVRQGYNRQQDGPNDGQARWNLISRSGQDVVSGIYVFTVESSQGPQRGKFVIIR